MYQSFLIHSFADGHLGGFQHLTIANCAAMFLYESPPLSLVHPCPWTLLFQKIKYWLKLLGAYHLLLQILTFAAYITSCVQP